MIAAPPRLIAISSGKVSKKRKSGSKLCKRMQTRTGFRHGCSRQAQFCKLQWRRKCWLRTIASSLPMLNTKKSNTRSGTSHCFRLARQQEGCNPKMMRRQIELNFDVVGHKGASESATELNIFYHQVDAMYARGRRFMKRARKKVAAS